MDSEELKNVFGGATTTAAPVEYFDCVNNPFNWPQCDDTSNGKYCFQSNGGSINIGNCGWYITYIQAGYYSISVSSCECVVSN